MTTRAIIQARIGSTRLPGKVLKSLWGVPMVERVIEAAMSAHYVDDVVVAIPDNEFALYQSLTDATSTIVRGHPTDVLARVQKASGDADVVVRLTSDCPFVSSAIIDYAIDTYSQLRGMTRIVYTHHDYHYSDWPDGFDVEVMSGPALRSLAGPDEHVTTGLYPGHPVPKPKLSVDTPRDLAQLRCVYCARGEPKHTNAVSSIGGEPRRIVPDLHAVDDRGGVRLVECSACEE